MIDTLDFQKLLEQARASTTKEHEKEAINKLQALVKKEDPRQVDLSLLGIVQSEDGSFPDEATDIIAEVISDNGINQIQTSLSSIQQNSRQSIKDAGVTRNITLNYLQQKFHDLVLDGESCVLIGAAGVGKTTCMRQVTRSLIDAGKLPKLSLGTKYLGVDMPGAAILSYTRKAVNNIRRAVVDELKAHTLTLHKLLEFAPVFFEIEDPNTGLLRKTMRFEPTRTGSNPLPPELCFVAFEEASMVGTDLYELFLEAMPHAFQEVFLGDIQQLPPIFGMAILGFKMNELPVVELTEVYRQARNSPIIDLAWKLLEGNPHVFSDKLERTVEGGKTRIKVLSLEALSRDAFDEETGDFLGAVKFQPWQKKLADEVACMTAIKQFCAWIEQGYYNPEEDIILCPYNKAFGTEELNRGISNYLGLKRGAKVHEVIAGFNKYYLAIGDRVLYDKEDAFITSISSNVEYLGKRPSPASIHLDRWGTYQEQLSEEEKLAQRAADSDMDLEAMEKFMAAAADAVVDRVQAASHDIVIRLAFSDEEILLSSASEVNNLLGGYAITLHKFQGSEAERIFFVLHHSHAKMVSRELLYTGVTRARKFLHIICEYNTFFKGISSQRIKGNTLKEKAAMFMGRATPEELLVEKEKLSKLSSHRTEVALKQLSNTLAEQPTSSSDKVLLLSDFMKNDEVKDDNKKEPASKELSLASLNKEQETSNSNQKIQLGRLDINDKQGTDKDVPIASIPTWHKDTWGDPAEELPERDLESGNYKIKKKTAKEILAEIKAKKVTHK